MEAASKEEVQLVIDSIKEAPEQFKELYEDLIANSLGGVMAEYITSNKEELDIDTYMGLKAYYDSL